MTTVIVENVEEEYQLCTKPNGLYSCNGRLFVVVNGVHDEAKGMTEYVDDKSKLNEDFMLKAIAISKDARLAKDLIKD